MYEHRSEPLLPIKKFFSRVLSHLIGALIIIAASLGLGIVGYHYIEGLSWLDSLLNAAMILGGMGPVDKIVTTDGKLFASFYALFSGIIFLASVGLIIAPIAHRLLHSLHIEEKK